MVNKNPMRMSKKLASTCLFINSENPRIFARWTFIGAPYATTGVTQLPSAILLNKEYHPLMTLALTTWQTEREMFFMMVMDISILSPNNKMSSKSSNLKGVPH